MMKERTKTIPHNYKIYLNHVNSRLKAKHIQEKAIN